MTETSRIADQLRRSYEGIAWHGPSLKEALDGVTTEMAGERCSADVHTIWEIVEHVGAWAAAARRFLVENYYSSLTGAADWPPPSADWPTALEKLASAQQQLWDYAQTLPDERLDETVSEEKKYTVYILLHGIVQHNLYHAGQISLLKKPAAWARQDVPLVQAIVEIVKNRLQSVGEQGVACSSDGPKELTAHEFCLDMAMDYDFLLAEIEVLRNGAKLAEG